MPGYLESKNKYFDLSDLKKSKKPAELSSDILCEKFLQIHTEKIESIKDLKGRFPEGSEIFFLWTVNSFNAFTFIPYIIKECEPIERLILSTYSINSRIVDSLTRYIDKGDIKSMELFISESMRFRMPKVVEHLGSVITKHSNIISVQYVWNHSKVTLIESAGNYFDIEGSGNWSENAKHEQYIFLNNKTVFDFRAKWIKNELHTRTD